jgi:tetratricopeptide (TPR) repeat protein
VAIVKLAISVLTALALMAQASFDYFGVQRDMFAGFAGDIDAMARAMAACEKALADNPKHPQALVWHGIGTLAQASRDPQRAPVLMINGISEMDRAVALEPGDLGVRIPRGAMLMGMARQLPDSPLRQEFIERGRGDFQFAFDVQARAGMLDSIGRHPLGELLQGLSDAYSRQGKPDEAQKYYEMIRAKLPDTEYARRAALWMETRQPLPLAQTACVGCHTGPRY